MGETPKSYDAFISYSSSLNGALAAALQQWLERFATPWYRPRSLRIFRDYTSLSASHDLKGALEEALSRASWFILLASPEAAKSRWVDSELAWWRAHRRADRVCLVLTSGKLCWNEDGSDWDWDQTDSLPPSARGMFQSEPLWVDLSTVHNAKLLDRSNPTLLNSVAQIAAPLRGVDKDSLVGDHITFYRRARRQRRLGVSALVVLLLVASALAGVAFQQRATAIAQRDRALSNNLLTEADQLRTKDVSLAAQLSLLAFRTVPAPKAYSHVIDTQASMLSAPITGHRDTIKSVSFSRSGKVLATGSEDKTVRLWNVAAPGDPTPLGKPLNGAVFATFSPDGKLLATGSENGMIRLWNARRPANLVSAGGLLKGFTFASFSPDGHILAVANDDSTVRLWSVQDPAHPVRAGQLKGHGNDVFSAVFSPDGQTLATGGWDQTVRLWNVANPDRPVALGPPLTGFSSLVLSVSFSADGRTLAAGSADPLVRFWNVSDPKKPIRLGSPAEGYHFVSFSPHGNDMIMCGDHTAELWNASDPANPGLLDDNLSGHTNAIWTAAFSPDGSMIATGSLDHTARLWRIPGTYLIGHSERVEALAFSVDGRVLATGSDDRTIRLWDMADAIRPVPFGRPLAGHHDTVSALAFSPSGRLLASGSSDKTIRLWNVADPRHPRLLGTPLTAHKDFVSALAFSPDGRILASGSFDGKLRLWDVMNPRRPINRLTADTAKVVALAFSRNGRILASGSTDQRIRMWNIADPYHPVFLGKPLAGKEQVPVLAAADVRLAFSQDSHVLATSGGDGTVRLWNIADPAHVISLVQLLPGKTNPLSGLAFSADGRTLATADDDVQLWNVADPAHPAPLGDPLTGNPGGVLALTFSPDGRILAASGGDDAARIWNMSAKTAINMICAATSYTLTPDQWRRYAPDLEPKPLCP